MNRLQHRPLFLLCLFVLSALTMAMGPARQNKTRKSSDERVHLLHADRLFFNERLNSQAQILVGDVQFEHEGMLLFCDSALFYRETNSLDAYGNVRMKQGDTLSLVSDVLFYNGQDEMARARYNVVLRHNETTLYTDSLDYDRLFDLGYFFNGGRMLNQNNQLTSDWGEYSPATHEAVFNYNVRLVNPIPPKPARSTLTGDTLHYNTETGVAHAIGPSDMYHDETHVYTENGYYDSKADISYLLDCSRLDNEYRTLVGDSLCWDNNEHVGKAYGNAVYTDTVNRNMFLGNYALYNDSTGYAEAADSAVLIDYSQPDTLYAHADSFFLYTFYKDTDSTYRKLHAYHHVRAFRRDLQAVCDSMVYDGLDSCATMYKDPIVWQEGQQLLGELIKVWPNDSTIDSVYVINQALSVERIDSVHYNQVASTEMHCYFENGEARLTVADKNVYVNYYPFDDDSLMIGMNHTESSEMRMFLRNRTVEKIWMPAATGTMYPLPLVPPDKLYLENFAWFDYIRPTDKDDIFHWRPKAKGTELKETAPRSAPRQHLQDLQKKQAGDDGAGESEAPAKNEENAESPEPAEPVEKVESSEKVENLETLENFETLEKAKEPETTEAKTE